MSTPLIVTKTKDYLVFKIPIALLKKRNVDISSREKKAIEEGLNAVKERKLSPVFEDAQEAIAFLRTLYHLPIPACQKVRRNK